MNALARPHGGPAMLRTLVGSGDRIGLVTLPFVVVGLILNVAFPAFFSAGGPSTALTIASLPILVVGVAVWGWSAALILMKVPRGELITAGPYRVVKHPLYTAVALLVLPWAGFLFNTWLGAAIGLILYIASRRFAPEEEAELSKRFGAAWTEYARGVLIPWL